MFVGHLRMERRLNCSDSAWSYDIHCSNRFYVYNVSPARMRPLKVWRIRVIPCQLKVVCLHGAGLSASPFFTSCIGPQASVYPVFPFMPMIGCASLLQSGRRRNQPYPKQKRNVFATGYSRNRNGSFTSIGTLFTFRLQIARWSLLVRIFSKDLQDL